MTKRFSRSFAIIFTVALLVGVAGCKKPKVQLDVSHNRIQQGEDVRVNWTSKDAKEVTINGEKVDAVGSKVYTPDNTTTYTAVAKRGKKEARDSKVVAVAARPPKPTITVSVDQGAIERGQSTTLRWNAINAEQVTITDLGTVPNGGSRAVSPSQSTTYTATATGPGGTDSASARLTVTEPVNPETGERPPANPTVPGVAEVFRQKVREIFFDYDKADLKPESRDTLRTAAAWLTESPNRSIVFRIEGNCDPRGTEEYNIGLGERRAQAAMEFLISLGVDSSRIQTVSYGEERAQGTSEGSPYSPPSFAHDRRDQFIYVGGGSRNPEPITLFFDMRAGGEQ
ncbi:MAG: OmpA family protein [Blastocatellia bacterium]|nr:OmpA family protein [Blastocatellia bacterium]